MQDELIKLLAGRTGHFQLESGYHSEKWYDVDRMFQQKEKLQPAVSELSRRLHAHRVDAVCGPMTGGAKLAEIIGGDLGLPFFFTERVEMGLGGLFSVRYSVPVADRAKLRGKRIAVVDDAISAGSAVRGTCTDLLVCGAQPIVIGALYILGDHAAVFASDHDFALEGIARMPFGTWKPEECPLCRTGVSVERVSDAGRAVI